MEFGAKATSLLAVMLLAAAPGWADSNVAALGRQCSEHGKQNACNELARIAVQDSNPEVRYAATRRLADQALLAKIAAGDPDANVRRAAIEKVSDQSLLVSAALNTKDAGVASVALGKLSDPSLLANIVAKATDANVRKAAVGKLGNPLILAKIAVESKDAGVRSTAAAKLTDQSLLGKIAREDEDAGVRSAATVMLTDQSLLAKIAQEDNDAAVRSAAVGKLADPSLLAQIALHDAAAQVRRVAVERLTDQSVIQKVAVEDSDSSVRSIAAQRLTDRTLVANIARQDEDKGVREAAASALATVQREHEVCIWRATKVDSGLARWKIRGNLGPSAMMGHSWSSIVDMQQSTELLFGRDCGSSPAPGFEKGWQFAPYDVHPGWVLESGSASVYDGNKGVELRPGVSFSGSALVRGRMSWEGSLGGRPKEPLAIEPLLYPTSEGTLALGGIGGFLLPASDRVPPFLSGLSFPAFTALAMMQANPAIVTGTLRFPDEKWTEVGGGFRIKGGGLQFDETGVFLIPGTQYNPREVFLLTTNEAVAGRDIDGLAPLFKAAFLGQKDLAASLLANHAEVNARDEDGRTPLDYAAARGHSDLARLLLENRAEVNARDNRGWAPLHYAADRGRKEIAELLLAHQAEVNARNDDGATALHFAAEHGYRDLAELLLANHADVNALDNQRSTPSHRAASNGKIDMTELLRTHGGQPLSDFSGLRLLDPKLAGLIETIVVLPVIDSRTDTTLTVDLNGVGDHVQKLFEKKGYQVLQADASPPGARWVARFTLASISGGLEPMAILYGTLHDNQSGTVSWQGIAEATNQIGPPPPRPLGLTQLQYLQLATADATAQALAVGIRALTLGKVRRKAVENALSKLSQKIPDRPKAK